MFTSPLTAAEELALHPARLAYVEGLTIANAPTLTIDADPSQLGEPLELVFVNQESLDRVKAVLLAEMRRSAALLQAQLNAGEPTPYNA